MSLNPPIVSQTVTMTEQQKMNHVHPCQKLNHDSSYPWDSPSVRTVLNLAGWGNRPVWLTETGLQSGAWGEGNQSFFYRSLLHDWFADGRSKSWLDRIFFYETADSDDTPEFTWGILGPPPELDRKQAFTGYGNFIASARLDDCEVVSAEVPEFFGSAQEQELRVVLKNTGGTSWSAEGYRLHAEVDVRNWLCSGGELPAGDLVAPGDEVTVILQIKAPYSSFFLPPEPARLVVRMERAGQWFFGDGVTRTLYLSKYTPPEFLVHPRSVVAEKGDGVTFTVAVSSVSRATFRWRRNSIELSEGAQFEGTGSPVLRIHSATKDTAADYDCVVSNAAGSISSNTARLAVGDAAAPYGVARRASGRVGERAEILEAWEAFRRQGRAAGQPSNPNGEL